MAASSSVAQFNLFPEKEKSEGAESTTTTQDVLQPAVKEFHNKKTIKTKMRENTEKILRSLTK